MNIALDVMGGDHGPGEIVAGAVEAARAYSITVTLVGKPDEIKAELAKHNTVGLKLPIAPATQVIEMHDKPANAIRAKPDASMVVAAKLVKSGQAQGFVSAGNTGGALAAGIFHVGRIAGVLRPALITPFPTHHGFCVILDVGANADVRPEHMQQFAIMGSIYAKHVMGVSNPVVRILSNGEEEGKGSQMVITAYNVLAATPGINFQGNVESKEIVEGAANVVVTDGFTGNVALKTLEGSLKTLIGALLAAFDSSDEARSAAESLWPSLLPLYASMDPENTGGAMLLGVDGVCIISHGSSSARAMVNAIGVAADMVRGGVVGHLAAAVAPRD